MRALKQVSYVGSQLEMLNNMYCAQNVYSTKWPKYPDLDSP